MFVPGDQRGGGEGGGGDRPFIISLSLVPILHPVEFTGKGEHFILLVKASKGVVCTCEGVIPAEHAPKVIAKVISGNKEEVAKAVSDSLSDKSNRKKLRTGEKEYIEALVGILQELFCKKELEFSCEKIG